MKLDAPSVEKMRILNRGGVDAKTLATIFEVSLSTVYGTIRNLAHYSKNYQPPVVRRFNTKYAKALKDKGLTNREIGAEVARVNQRSKPYSCEHVRVRLKQLEA